MKTTEFIVENSIIAQEADNMHRDHEVQMARSQMYSAAQAAIEIHRLLRDISEMEGIEGWVASKLTLASEYLESVRDYLKYEAVDQEPKMMVFAENAANYAVESIIKRSMKEQTTIGPGGMSRTVGPGGDITTRSDVGGTSVSQTKTPGGFTKQTTADYDMGGAGSASMVKSAPQQPGQMAGTTTVTRTAAAPKYDADAGIAANTPAVKPASGSAVQGVAFGGASGKNVGNNVVTTGDANLAAQAKAVMPAPNANLEEEGMEEQQTPAPGTSTPVVGGMAKSTDPAGRTTTSYNMGPVSVSKSTGGGQTDVTSASTQVMDKTVTQHTGVGFGGAGAGVQQGGNKITTVTEKNKKLKEMATGGASSAGAMATSMAGPAHKRTSGVPKKVGNAYKPKKVVVGKGVY